MLTIREATERDLGAVLETERVNRQPERETLIALPWNDDACLQILQARLDANRLLLCDDAFGTIGHYYYALAADDAARLESLQVMAGRRREGIGSFMLEDFLRRMRLARIGTVRVEIPAGNLAFRLFRRFGFQEEGTSAKGVLYVKLLTPAEGSGRHHPRIEPGDGSVYDMI